MDKTFRFTLGVDGEEMTISQLLLQFKDIPEEIDKEYAEQLLYRVYYMIRTHIDEVAMKQLNPDHITFSEAIAAYAEDLELLKK